MTDKAYSGDRVVALARDWIGTPYRHQASQRGQGADCLGLIRGVWRELGGDAPATMPRYTPDWSEARGEEELWRAARAYLTEVAEPAPGDVLLFRMRARSVAKHLGIYAGPVAQGYATFIHAYQRHGVVEVPFGAAWQARLVAAFRFPER